MNEEELSIRALKKIKKTFDENNIEYWLDEGTLLGAVREKSFIPWDHDIDVGVWQTTIPHIIPLFNEFRKQGFTVCFHEEKQHIKLLVQGREIDINPYVERDTKATRTWYEHNTFGRFLDYVLWTMHMQNPHDRPTKAPVMLTISIVALHKTLPQSLIKKITRILFIIYEQLGGKRIPMAVPSHYFTSLTTLTFYNMIFKVPKKTEEYLQYRYGKDWKTPKRDYRYTKDDKSIVQP
jgi:hypothetical protein